MTDQSHLDQKYFIDPHIYNCPFCKRGHVSYAITAVHAFNWSSDKKCYVYFVACRSCRHVSMHLSYEVLVTKDFRGDFTTDFGSNIDLDSRIFYSVPTSFFVIDDRIPKVLRELITEAEGCLKMNFLTGASACTRKAIYELTVKEKAAGKDYEGKIKDLKHKHSSVDPTLFDVLGHIQGMTSDHVHEQSWPHWDTDNLKLILETLKAVLHEMYVVPKERQARSSQIQQLKEKVEGKEGKPPSKRVEKIP